MGSCFTGNRQGKPWSDTLIWLLHIGPYAVATLSADFAGRAHHTEMADTGKIAATPAGQTENSVAAVVGQVLDIVLTASPISSPVCEQLDQA